ncbi:MAG: hypothetical protein NXI10_09335 [bacterium]|nr:hypothetical protein [bacterium]
MKKLISTLAFVLGVVALSFAQDVKNTAMSQGSEALLKSKETGTYLYTLPAGTTSEQVTKAASYYTNYFTVNFDETSREAKVEIIGDKAPSTQVMLRFLSGCGVMYVNVDGEDHQLNMFYADYVK